MPEPKRPLKVFLCHAHADRDPVPQGDNIPQGDDVRGLPEGARLTQVSNGPLRVADSRTKADSSTLACIIALHKPKSVSIRESVIKSVDHKHPLKVFLCHAHADRDPVRGLYARLTQDGVDSYPWLDKEKL